MREILFRGKRTENGEWKYGLPHYNLDNEIEFITVPGKIYPNCFKVDPDTVGQYTGLTDKNGRKIFEGDIVDYISSDVIGNHKTGTIIVEDMTDYDTMIYLNHSDELQIIGNIHDNPDILKGGGENG